MFCIFIAVLFAGAAQGQNIESWKLADLQKALLEADRPTVINFWATFCKPCIAELPHFQALADKYKSRNLKLIMVSLDLKEAFPKKVAAFVRRRKLTSAVVWLNESNADLFCPAVDSSWSGAIPATLLINNVSGYRRFFEEELSRSKLEAELKKMLGE